MITLNIQNETRQLEAVVLGIANSFGGTPSLKACYDPKSKEHVKAGTFPKEQSIIPEMEAVCDVLENYGVKVYRPKEIAKSLVITTSAESLALTKELINGLSDKSISEGFNWASEMNAKARETNDCKKGIIAFLNKEKMKW